MESSEEFVPRSARIEFMFHMSKAANERPEFIALKEETDQRISEFRKFLSTQIIKATRIECEVYADQIRESFVKAIRVAIQGFLVGDDAFSNLECDAVISTIFETRSDRLLRHTTFQSIESFYDRYTQVHNLAAFPIRSDSSHSSSAATSAPRSPFFQSTQTTNSRSAASGINPTTNPIMSHNFDSIVRAIESIFVLPFDEYLKQCKKNQISLELKKLSTSHFSEDATASTQMELDREPSLDQSQLQDLIRRQAKVENKALVQEIAKLQKQMKNLQSKNSQRGRSPQGGASSQKEIKQSVQKNSQTSKKKSAPKAAAVDKDINKKSRKQKNEKDNKGTTKNGTKSKTKRNK
jgi:hypothetical protein